ncbi:zinc-dependent metalloprotease [Anthocerotibacter panamensis]|uniref:zinc-dependent metalloprotease n=1 Tax=Anthocerotibacter panamensis TaxID=2857077 RepID=UPI001C4029ED|nr:zinc-dependent metalloprotease [Anthocerotibacter panamensis]
MNRLAALSACLLLALSPVLPVYAAPEKQEAKAAKPEEAKSFDARIKGYKAIPGLFTLYVNADENKVLMEVKPEQLNKIYLASVTQEAGDGVYTDSGAQVGEFPFVLKKIGPKIQILQKNVAYRAADQSPISRAISRGVSDSILGSAKIESKPHPQRKSLLIDPSGIFLQDYANLGYFLGEASEPKGDLKFDRQESYFNEFKSFPLNTELEAVLHFKSNRSVPTTGQIPDSRSLLLRYHYSLSTLPDTGYRPRLADDRVGTFMTLFQDYTDQTLETPYVRYVNRWHLEKQDPKAPLSPPKQPIVFWLENTIPVEYRQATTEGILMWNKAFEQVGIKDAIVVKQQPDDADWDPADVRYNTIRWIVKPGGGFAVGPSRTNPFTGEIYDADIRVSSDFVRYFTQQYQELVDPLAAFQDEARPTGKRNLSTFCSYGRGMARELAFGQDLLQARATLNPTGLKEYLHSGIRELIAHEVGHTLGMRHNFHGSTIHPLSQAQDKTLTSQEGISASVMDYNPVNLAPKGKAQGEYFNSGLGLADYWTIEYAYTPIAAPTPEAELPQLQKIANRGAEAKLAFGTDEDAFGSSAQGIDPTTNLYDLGEDPIAFYKERIDFSQEILGSVDSTFLKEGERYQKFRRVFATALQSYSAAASIVPKFVGGVYHYRDHIGSDRVPFEPVSVAKQKEALAFLEQNIFGPEAFQFAPSLIAKLQPERFPDFDFAIIYAPRIDYPVHSAVLTIQKRALDRLYHPIVLNRLVDLPLYTKPGDPVFTMADMFGSLRQSIWSEVYQGGNINSFRRNLQQTHLKELMSLVVQPKGAPFTTPFTDPKPAGMILPPADAIALARVDLLDLQRSIRAFSKPVDPLTRAHLDEALAQITAALEAKPSLKVN